MELVPLLALSALVWKLVDWLKMVRQGKWNGVWTQAIVWGAGIVGVFLAAQTDYASGISIGDKTLTQLNGWSKVFVGLQFASLTSVGFDTKKALDASDSAKMPPLLDKP
jgi:hypothetical protein